MYNLQIYFTTLCKICKAILRYLMHYHGLYFNCESKVKSLRLFCKFIDLVLTVWYNNQVNCFLYISLSLMAEEGYDV